MRAIVLTATGLRHNYFAKVVAEHFDLCGVITQPKTRYYKDDVYESELVKTHFTKLEKTEALYFPLSGDVLDVERYETNDINDEECVGWAKEKNPEVIFLFGTRILGNIWLKKFENVINLHLGLSPFYRGSATLFWPFVNKEISCVGATIHLAVKEVDGGPILKRVKPDLAPGDDYYEINYKTIKSAIDNLPQVVLDYFQGLITPLSQKNMKKGFLYKKKDFTENVLLEALEYVGDGLTKEHIIEIAGSSECNC